MFSASSYLVDTVTNFRNPEDIQGSAHPLKRVIAEVGYAVTLGISLVEAIVSIAAKAFSSILPLSEKTHKAMSEWALSSCSAFGLSLAYFLIANPWGNHISPING